MTIDLRKYFLGNSETLEYELDLSGMELGGVKPFCAPAKVQIELKGSAASVELAGRAETRMFTRIRMASTTAAAARA